MLKFVTLEQKHPEKRAPALRRRDWGEVYDDFRPEAAADQAARCSQCGVPFCQIHCPVSNNIPDWLMLTAEGRLEEAYEISSATNNMPEICGRICPQDRLCEGNCVIEKGFESVTIGAVERYITDTAFRNGWVKPPAAQGRAAAVGRHHRRGPGRDDGRRGAAPPRLPGPHLRPLRPHGRADDLWHSRTSSWRRPVVERRTELICSSRVASQIPPQLRGRARLLSLMPSCVRRHDAILIATGVYKARDIEGARVIGLGNIVPALDYLTASQPQGTGRCRAGLRQTATLNAQGKKVVVIGGGDTAMDCVRTAVRQGAISVKCLYRRNRANMPGSVPRGAPMPKKRVSSSSGSRRRKAVHRR